MERTLSVCFLGLDKLISIFVDGEVSDVGHLLEHRLSILHSWLKSDAALDLRENFPRQLKSLSCDEDSSPVVRYSLSVICLLECVGECLRSLSKVSQSLPGSTPASSAPPAGTLSCRQRLRLQSALQHVLSLCVLPCLPRGVGVSLEQRSDEAVLIRQLASTHGTLISRRSHALLCIDRLLLWSERFDSDQLAPLLLCDSVLPDLLALLALVAHGPNPQQKTPPATLAVSQTEYTRDNGQAEISDWMLVKEDQKSNSEGRKSTTENRKFIDKDRKSITDDLKLIAENRKYGDYLLLQQQRVTAGELLGRVTASVNTVGSRIVMGRAILLLQRCAQQSVPVRRWLCVWCWRRVYDMTCVTGGLAEVTEALLHFWGQDRVDHVPPTHVQAAAKLLVSLSPPGLQLSYYKHLSCEVLRLLRLPRAEVRVSCVRVAAAIVQALCSTTSSAHIAESSRHHEVVDPVPSIDAGRLVDEEVLRPLIGCLLTARSASENGVDCVTDGVDRVSIGVDHVSDGVDCVSNSVDRLADGVDCVCQLFVTGMEPLDSSALRLLIPYGSALLLLYTRWRGGVLSARASCLQLLARVASCWGAEESCNRLLLMLVVSSGGVDWQVDGWECGDTRDCINVDGIAAAFAEVITLACETDRGLLVDVLVYLCQRIRSAGRPLDTGSVRGVPTVDSSFLEAEERGEEVRRVLLCVHAVAALTELDSAVDRLIEGASRGETELIERLVPAIASLLTQSDYVADDALTRQSIVSALALTGVLLTSAAAAEPATGAPSGALSTASLWKIARQKLGPHLERLLAPEQDRRIRETARCLYDLVLTNGVIDSRVGSGTGTVPSAEPQSEFARTMYQLEDPVLPVRAHAVIRLSQLLRERDPVTWQNRLSLLPVFQERLCEDDSYIYLAAVRGLSCLADLCTDQVIDPLCGHYVSRERDTDTRLKLGECIIYMVSQLGDLAPVYSNRLLNAFLAGCRDPDDTIRSSSLCNLSELCRLLRYSVSPVINEVLLCVFSLLDTDPSVQVRRAAVLCISQLLSGLGQDTFTVLADHLPRLYRRVKLLLQRESDSALLRHANNALQTINSATSRSLSQPARQPLQKHIRILR